MSRARPPTTPSTTETQALTDIDAWQLADGVMFSVLSSLVLWSIIIASLYHALT